MVEEYEELNSQLEKKNSELLVELETLRNKYEIMKENAETLAKRIDKTIDIIQEMRKDDYYNGIGYELSYLESILKGDRQ